jgi:DNA-binding protein Fis
MTRPFQLSPAEQVLDLAFQALALNCGARICAAWRREGERMQLVLGRPIHSYLLGAAEGVWIESRAVLERGLAVREAGGVFVPLRDEDGSCAGLLALDVDPDASDGAQRDFVAAIVESVRQAVRDSAAQERVWPLDPALSAVNAASRLERAQLLSALEHCEWNVSRAARELGVTKQALYRRMHKHGVARPRPARQGFAVRPLARHEGEA